MLSPSWLPADSKLRAKLPLCIALFFALACILFFAAPAEALDLGSGLAKGTAVQAGYDGGTNETTFAETIGALIKAVLSFTGVIFLGLTVYAGFLWMNARGDENQIEKSQAIIRSAIIGLVITVGAYSITNFVVPRIVEKTAGGAPPQQEQNANPQQAADACRERCQQDCARQINVDDEELQACINQCVQQC